MKKTNLLASVMGVILILLDQGAKLLALEHLRGGPSIPVIPHFFLLSYVENRGAAFGIFQGNVLILGILTGIVLLAGLFFVYTGKVAEVISPRSTYVVMLVLAGGLGNLYDRLFRQFVVDYLDFSALFNFPVFNLADCYVVIGTILLVIIVFRQDLALNKARKDQE